MQNKGHELLPPTTQADGGSARASHDERGFSGISRRAGAARGAKAAVGSKQGTTPTLAALPPPSSRGKEFNKRIATEYADKTIVALGPGSADSTSRQVANLMAAGWAPAMQQRQAGTSTVAVYLDAGAVGNSGDLKALEDPITTEETTSCCWRRS
ncbi:hypothetical protein PybrP1_012815 [[Pythium] brassicae (nom. inval.)]|nr:hypothetical protein PybrP1_012815 [[Pythium] brassicae (nom. inval.)]